MNKKINLISNVVLPIVAIAVTVALFFLFKPKETTELFYINLVFTVILEGVFFGFLNVLHLKKDGVSTPFVTVFGMYSIFYIILGAVWMLGYSLLISGVIPEDMIPYRWLRMIYAFFQSYPVPLKIYVAVIAVLTLLWIGISLLTAQIDSNFKQTTDKLKADGQTLNYYTQKIALLASRYEKLCAEKGIKYATDSNNKTVLERLKGKISFLTPNILTSETAVSQLNMLFSKCEDIIEETEMATEEKFSEVSRKMQRFVDNAIAELDMLKNLTRK
ncbi:MAG: hypothetical protein LBR06_02390 [Bacteroidales bacterium]|jgi:hypothetical protein|nr:hypothetical protein [Bacteroidales bacterium]